MKTGFLVMTLTTALLAGAVTGKALAGDSMANSADPESAMNQTWTGQGAMDTGKLPDESGGASTGSRIVSGTADIPSVDTAGGAYRLGVDTGP